MASLLRSLPPSTTVTGLPAHAPRRPRGAAAGALVVRCSCATAAEGGRAGSADDYHATLRALNSKGARCTPRKSLGQHYMLNSSINEQLSSIAEIKEGDVVLEIGPGTGSLTNILVDAGATVVAVEKDPHMAALVRDRFQGVDQLMVLQEDFTKFHIRSYISHLLESKKSMGIDIEYAKVVSNIPFNISTDVVKRLLPLGDIFSDVVLLLQVPWLVQISSIQRRKAAIFWMVDTASQVLYVPDLTSVLQQLHFILGILAHIHPFRWNDHDETLVMCYIYCEWGPWE